MNNVEKIDRNHYNFISKVQHKNYKAEKQKLYWYHGIRMNITCLADLLGANIADLKHKAKKQKITLQEHIRNIEKEE